MPDFGAAPEHIISARTDTRALAATGSSGPTHVSMARFRVQKFQGSPETRRAADQPTERLEPARTSDGASPYRRRKHRLKCERSPNPAS
jgi:hypothetical protein